MTFWVALLDCRNAEIGERLETTGSSVANPPGSGRLAFAVAGYEAPEGGEPLFWSRLDRPLNPGDVITGIRIMEGT